MNAAVQEVFADAMGYLVPPDRPRMADWLRDNFYNEEGKLFDEYSVPWVTAPNGPCDAIDNVQYQTVWLQWAARMFKTQFGQSLMMMHADVDPCRMMFASTDETMVKGVFGRLWTMLEHCPPLKHHIPPERLRNKTHLRLAKCEIHGAWPRGKSRLADKSIRVGHANEVDKWVMETTSTEGHPLARFRKRGDQFPDRKFVIESTPGQHFKSSVEDGRLQSTNCRYEVPCPSCGKFQMLRLGDGQRPGGIFWEKDAAGRSTSDMALRTAFYVCQYCEEHIDDLHRPGMINAGVWVHEGCTVDHDLAMQARECNPLEYPWMKGEPLRNGSDYGSQISSLYALFWGWGKIAERFLLMRRKTHDFRQFVNEDLGDTWTVTERQETPEKICERMATQIPRGVIPRDCPVLTMGIDKQKDHYVYVVKAWGAENRCHTVQYGKCHGEAAGDKSGGLSEITQLLQTRWPVSGSDGVLQVRSALIDSGHFPKDVSAFVNTCRRSGLPVFACKGSSVHLDGLFRKTVLGKASATPGMQLVLVDAAESQGWMEDALYKLSASDPWGMTLYAGSYFDHEEYFAELVNDAPVDRIDPRGNVQITWDRLDRGTPNDYRDCERYAMVAYVAGQSQRKQVTIPQHMRRV